MKQSLHFIRILSGLVILFMASSTQALSAPGDSVKPLPQINKHFLVVAHIVVDKQGNPGIDPATIASLISGMDGAFAPIGASFELCQVDTILNFTYDTLSNTAPRNFEAEMLVKYNIAERINVYFVSNFPDKPTACAYANLGGISTGKMVVAKKGSCSSVGTFIHEFGHFFNLEHTFEKKHGLELVDESNCTAAGDGICDTPADPFIEGSDLKEWVNSDCVFINKQKDSNSQYYDPDVGNVMSYYGNCVCGKFSHQQYEKMANYYLTHRNVW